jgi:hypothetical protein
MHPERPVNYVSLLRGRVVVDVTRIIDPKLRGGNNKCLSFFSAAMQVDTCLRSHLVAYDDRYT